MASRITIRHGRPRPDTPRSWALALAVGALVLAPLAAPLVVAPAPPAEVAAMALPRPTELLARAWDHPVDPAARAAFVDAWAARFADEASAAQVLRGDVPDASAWTPEERLALARGLTERLVGPGDAAVRMKTLLVYGLLFDRAGVAAMLQGPAPPAELGAPSPPAMGEATTDGAEVFPFEALQQRLHGDVAGISAGASPRPDPNEALRPPIFSGPRVAPPEVAAEAPPRLSALRPPGPEPDLVNLPPPLDALPSALPYLGPASVATYRACGQGDGQPVVCSIPVPLGTPVALDVDGAVGLDLLVHLAPVLLPEAIANPGSDPAELLTAPEAVLVAAQENANTLLGGGAAVTLRIQTLLDATEVTSGGMPCDLNAYLISGPPYVHADFNCILRLPSLENNIITPFEQGLAEVTGPRELVAKAWAEYEVPTALNDSMALRLGVDGLGSKIPEVSTIAFRITSLATLFAGRLLGDLNVTFEQPGDDVTIFGEVSDVDGQGQSFNPTTAALHMTPVPDLHADLDVLLDGTHAIVDLAVTETTLATITYEDDQTVPEAAYTRAVGIADMLPERVRVEYLDLADGSRLVYNASAIIGTVTGMYLHDDALWHLEGSAHIEQLPEGILLDLHTDDKEEGLIHYDASSVVPLAKVTFSALNKTGGVTALGSATVRDVPAAFDITYDATQEPERLLYEASSELGPVDLAYYTLPAGLAIEAHVESLPRVVEVLTDDDFTQLDARSEPGAPEASGSIGLVDLAFSTDGVFLPPEPLDTHVVVRQFTPLVQCPGPVQCVEDTTRLHLRYEGLQFLLADLRGEETHVDVRNAAERLLRFDVDEPGAHVRGFVDRVPDRVTVDEVGTVLAYGAHGDTVDQVHLEYDDKEDPPMVLTVDAFDVPAWITLDLDLDNKTMVYDASAGVTRVTGVGTVPTELDGIFDLRFDVEDIPTHFDVGFAEGALTFAAPDGLGRAALLAHTVPPTFADPRCGYQTGVHHLCAALRDVPLETVLSFEVEEVRQLGFLQTALPDGGTGNHITLEADTAELFLISVLLEPAPEPGFAQERVTVFGTLDPLPSEVSLRTGPVITYEGSEPFALDLTAEFGHVGHLDAVLAPAAPVQGVGIHLHDEAHGEGAADDVSVVKTRAVLTGVGSFVEVDTVDTGFTMDGWQPTLPDLTFDMVVDDDATTAEDESVEVAVVVHEAAPDGDQDLSGRFANGPADGLAEGTTEVGFTFADPIEPADPAAPGVEAVIVLAGTRVAFAVRNLPTALAFTIRSLGSLEVEGGGIEVGYDADGAVKRVVMGLDILAAPDTDFALPNDFTGAFTLAELPTDFAFSVVRNAVGQAITYAASDPHGLKDPSDLDLDLEIGKGPLHVKMHAEDLGAAFSMTPVPGEVDDPPDTRKVPINECETKEVPYVPTDHHKLKSSPATSVLAVQMSDSASQTVEGFGGRWCFDLGPISFQFFWGFSIWLDMTVQNLGLLLHDLGEARLTTGFINQVKGNYGSFAMAWGDSHGELTMDIGGGVKACWDDTCINPFGLLLPISPGETFDLSSIRFYRAKASKGEFLVPVTFEGPCLPTFIEFDFKATLPINLEPHPEGSQDNLVTADGGTWYFLPSPFKLGAPVIPAWIAALILWIGSDAKDKGVSFSFPGIPLPVPSVCSPI